MRNDADDNVGKNEHSVCTCWLPSLFWLLFEWHVACGWHGMSKVNACRNNTMCAVFWWSGYGYYYYYYSSFFLLLLFPLCRTAVFGPLWEQSQSKIEEAKKIGNVNINILEYRIEKDRNRAEYICVHVLLNRKFNNMNRPIDFLLLPHTIFLFRIPHMNVHIIHTHMPIFIPRSTPTRISKWMFAILFTRVPEFKWNTVYRLFLSFSFVGWRYFHSNRHSNWRKLYVYTYVANAIDNTENRPISNFIRRLSGFRDCAHGQTSI